jgi:serine/threonine protein kinase
MRHGGSDPSLMKSSAMPHATSCPTPDELERFLGEDVADAERSAIETHVDSCARCQDELERLVASTSPLAREPSDVCGRNVSLAASDEAFLARLREQTPRKPDDDAMPSQLGPYEILGRLGRGGMGAVYRARHRELDKVVALKVLPSGRVNEAAVARFRTEMKAAGRLDHPNIVTSHDAGRAGDVHYLVTELVEGLDLAQLVGRRGPLAAADTCELGRQAATGLAHAHGRGLVHRDVKPSNLMLSRAGVVKVLDLGLARMAATGPGADALTATGFLLGTADYIAPEQIERPQAAGDRADVYGLGATLYFLLAGEPPFGGDRERSWLDKLQAHQNEPVPPLGKRRADLPSGLATLIESMLAKKPADRPAAAVVAAELKSFAAGANLRGLIESAGIASDPVAVDPRAETTSPLDTQHGVPHAKPITKRGRALVTGAAVFAAVLVGGLLWSEFHPQGPGPALEPVRILGVEVRQVRSKEARPVGLIGVDRKEILVDDAARISVKLSSAAHAYLIAFNPDGREQFCYPEAETEAIARSTTPPRVAELQFPNDRYFVFDSAGMQAFVLAASARPLPPYGEWQARAGTAPWKPAPTELGGVWKNDGAAWAELVDRTDLQPVSKAVAKLKLPDFMKKQSGTGKVEKRGKEPPKALADLAAFFRASPDFDAVEVVGFPVFRPAQ